MRYCFFLLSIFCFPALGQDSLTFRFQDRKIPEYIINSNFVIEARLVVNSHRELFAFMMERQGYSSDNLEIKAIKLDSLGKLVFERGDFLPADYRLVQIIPDKKGGVWISTVIPVDKDKSYAAILRFDAQLNRIDSIPLTTAYFPAGIALNPKGELMMALSADSIMSVRGQNFRIRDFGIQVLRIPDIGKIEMTSVPCDFQYLNDRPVMRFNGDGSFYLMQNTTILRGADHHEAHIWYFKNMGSKPVHRHLVGEGELEYLWFRKSLVNTAGELVVEGYSNDHVNFGEPGVFFREQPLATAPKPKKKTRDENADDYNEGFGQTVEEFAFRCVYDRALRLKSYTLLEEVPAYFSSMSYPDEEANELRLGNGIRITYTLRDGLENTNDSPTLTIYRNK